MKRRILCIALALCMCIPLIPAAYAADGTVPTPQEVYNTLTALKSNPAYAEGTPWDNDNHSYTLSVPVNGATQNGVGCAAFAFALSDQAFGTLPARQIMPVSISQIHTGDILRLDNNTHSVIVLQVGSESVIVAEANYHVNGGAGMVHWGRSLTAGEVAAADFMITRWPENYSFDADPDEPVDDGASGQIDGTSLEWKVTNSGTLFISGSGAMPESFTFGGGNSSRPWHAYTSSILSIVIGEGVTSVSDSAFRECTNLSSVSISEGVASIGQNAFRSCTALKSITLPSTITKMGAGAFYQCTALTTAVFTAGNNTVSMGDDLFIECWALSTVTLPKQIDCVSTGMFQKCLTLTSVTIPEGVEAIGGSAFASCSALKQIWVPASVTSIASAAFSGFGVTDIYFGGTEDEWNSISKTADVTQALEGVEIHYNAQAPVAPGGSTNDGDNSGTNSGTNSGANNATSSYAPSSSASNTTTTTSRNPDGSTTTTKTNSSTGTVTATTKYPDGSQTVVETQKNGTVTTQTTDQAGNKTETVAKPDGSSAVTVERKDGSTASATITAAGKMEAVVNLSAPVVSAAQQSGGAVTLPIPEVRVTRNAAAAPVITVNTGSAALVKVEIPTAAPAPGAVAVVVHADGTEEVVKTSVPTADGVAAPLADGVTVKIVDNSKDFTDVSSQHWALEAIGFVSARELFSGTTETTFTPEAPMTRAMLMTVLARFDGADTTSGATWYEKGMEWAVANGISDGSSPGESITREQLVTMLWRYAGCPQSTGTLSSFVDADQTSSYAQEAMRWAAENGIVNGFGDGRIGPQGQATRAQVAQMLENSIVKQLLS